VADYGSARGSSAHDVVAEAAEALAAAQLGPSVLTVEPRSWSATGSASHRGQFMGNGHNCLVLYTDDDGAWVRAAGTWDPMPWHVEQSYRRAGRAAQHAFWGQGEVARLSMLHQLALQIR
jgi:hypothetical protein